MLTMLKSCNYNHNFTGLYTSRGSFLTLSSLLVSTFKTSPVATTMQVNNQDFHVIYQAYEEGDANVAMQMNAC